MNPLAANKVDVTKLSLAQQQHDLRKAIQTVRMTHRLLELGYRFDDCKAGQMLSQLQHSIDLVEHRIALCVGN